MNFIPYSCRRRFQFDPLVTARWAGRTLAGRPSDTLTDRKPVRGAPSTTVLGLVTRVLR